MRKLGQELGVEAMSLYTHVRNKDDLLDGMVEAIVSEIPTSLDAAGWKTSLRRTVLAARSVILRHPWAPDIIESRTAPGPALLQYFNAVIGILREGGLSISLTHHACTSWAAACWGSPRTLTTIQRNQAQRRGRCSPVSWPAPTRTSPRRPWRSATREASAAAMTMRSSSSRSTSSSTGLERLQDGASGQATRVR
jgi:AcrR family transcriptional regulator